MTRYVHKSGKSLIHIDERRPSALVRPEDLDPALGKQEGRSWYRVNNDASGSELWIYDSIGGWGIWADEFVASLQEITSPTITVHVNSPGGDVFDGIAIMNALAQHPAKITVSVDSLAASIASVIAVGAADELVMQPHSKMMIHDASGLTVGDAAEHRKMADLLDMISQDIAEVYSERAGGTADEWREVMAEEKWYLPADAVAAKLADRVGELRSTEQEDDEGEALAEDHHMRWIHAAYKYGGIPAASVEPTSAPHRTEIDHAATAAMIREALR